MLNLRELTWNIFELCDKNPDCPDKGVAFSMVMNNIRHGREIDHGTSLPWSELQKQWGAMTADEQKASRAAYWLTDDALGLWDAYKAGDREKFEAIIVAHAEAAKEAEEGQA